MKTWAQLVIEIATKKTTLVAQIAVLSDARVRLQALSLSHIQVNILVRNTLSQIQREPFLTLFYTSNSSPLLVIELVLKLLYILSNYQMCPVPLNTNPKVFLKCNMV